MTNLSLSNNRLYLWVYAFVAVVAITIIHSASCFDLGKEASTDRHASSFAYDLERDLKSKKSKRTSKQELGYSDKKSKHEKSQRQHISGGRHVPDSSSSTFADSAPTLEPSSEVHDKESHDQVPVPVDETAEGRFSRPTVMDIDFFDSEDDEPAPETNQVIERIKNNICKQYETMGLVMQDL